MTKTECISYLASVITYALDMENTPSFNYPMDQDEEGFFILCPDETKIRVNIEVVK